MALVHILTALREKRRALRIADWLLALAACGVAAWTRDPWWVAGAALAVLLAIVGPLDRVVASLPHVVRRKPGGRR